MQTKKILIVDDDIRFRGYVKELLSSEKDLHIIGEAANGKEALCKAKELKPDLVLMDISMPWMSGLDATRQLKKMMPELAIIILTIYDLVAYREAAMARGATAYVPKKDMMKELLPAIRMALS